VQGWAASKTPCDLIRLPRWWVSGWFYLIPMLARRPLRLLILVFLAVSAAQVAPEKH
jgi:hypothetical protein